MKTSELFFMIFLILESTSVFISLGLLVVPKDMYVYPMLCGIVFFVCSWLMSRCEQ